MHLLALCREIRQLHWWNSFIQAYLHFLSEYVALNLSLTRWIQRFALYRISVVRY